MYEFKFARNFPSLIQADFDNAYDEVSITWSGIGKLWNILASEIRQAKRDLCYQYLTAWHLANMYPDKVVGIVSDGGIPLASKSIGGTSITKETIEVQDGLKQLKSNTFGLQALAMIQSCPERAGVFG